MLRLLSFEEEDVRVELLLEAGRVLLPVFTLGRLVLSFDVGRVTLPLLLPLEVGRVTLPLWLSGRLVL